MNKKWQIDTSCHFAGEIFHDAEENFTFTDPHGEGSILSDDVPPDMSNPSEAAVEMLFMMLKKISFLRILLASIPQLKRKMFLYRFTSMIDNFHSF